MLSSFGGKQKGPRQVMPHNSLLLQELTSSHGSCADPSVEQPTTSSPTQTPHLSEFLHWERNSHTDCGGQASVSAQLQDCRDFRTISASSKFPNTQAVGYFQPAGSHVCQGPPSKLCSYRVQVLMYLSGMFHLWAPIGQGPSLIGTVDFHA